MYNHKTLKDLTMKDNFMFGAVMSIEENCIGFFEMGLPMMNFPIHLLFSCVILIRLIKKFKSDREMGERYMVFEEMLREERQEGLEAGQLKAKREAVIELLEELGIVPESLIVQVESVEDFESLTALLKLAAKADSIDSFEKDAAQFFSEK